MSLRTYVFRLEEFEFNFGACAPSNYVMLHIFSGDVHIGAVRLNGSVINESTQIKEVDLVRYWDCFE